MAHFFQRNPEQIPLALKVGELRPTGSLSEFSSGVIARRDRKHSLSSAECWHVIFSPDETRFAWLCGQSRVVLVPWNRYKGCLLAVDNRDPDGNEMKGEVVYIDAGTPVNSAAFGCGTPEAQLDNNKIPHKQYWTRFDFSRDLVFATGHANGRVRIWDISTGRLLLELMDHREAVRDMAFAPDGSLRLVTASLDRTLKVWDLKDDGNMFKTLKGHQGEVMWCCWSPNSKLLASAGGSKNVLVWDMENYELARALEGHHHNVVCCQFSPDGAILASASWDTRVLLWDPYTGQVLRSLFHLHPPPRPIFASGANSSWVRGLSYGRHGLQIATIADDGFVRFWNLLGDSDPVSIAWGEDEMVCCTFSPSSRVLAVGTRESRVTFYAAPSIVPPLKHLARMGIRSHVSTPQVDQLDLPSSLKSYLKYQEWS